MRVLGSGNGESCPGSSQKQSKKEKPASELLPEDNGITEAGARGSRERRDERVETS